MNSSGCITVAENRGVGGLKVRARFGFCLLATVLIGCAYDPISYMAELRQPLDRMLVVGPGDVLVRVDKFRSLINDEGKADIFGRRTNEGYTEMRFGSVESDGTLVLLRNDYVIVTNENTETRPLFRVVLDHGQPQHAGYARTSRRVPSRRERHSRTLSTRSFRWRRS